MVLQSPNRTVNMVLRIIGEEKMQGVDEFAYYALARDYTSFHSEDELHDFFDSFL